MEPAGYAVIAVLILAFGIVSGRLEKTVITPPMVFVSAGLLMGPAVLGWIELDVESHVVRTLAEATLVLVLFADASRIDLAVLRRGYHLPLRLLGIGMPLAIALGTLAAMVVFEMLGPWEAAVVAAILAPTDAALGQAVVSSPRVPVRVRQALNVESGLNDGLALPFVLILLSIAGAAQDPQPAFYWVLYAAKQVLLGPLVGIAVGYLGGRLVSLGAESNWMNHNFQQIAALALALLAFAGAESVGGNGFIAAFAAGLTIGNSSRMVCHCLYDFAETEGQLLALLAFMTFGAADIWPAVAGVGWPVVLYALLSLTVVRMLPVSFSLLGSEVGLGTHLFIGWFGPRGLASILYVFLVLERVQVTAREEIFVIVVITVLTSVFAHGLTAWPATNWYANHADKMVQERPDCAEQVPVEEMRVRLPFREAS